MALTKDRAAITQVTATGQSSALSLATAYRSSLYIRHVNGTGSISVGATVQVQVRVNSVWYNLGGPFVFGTTASAAETRVVQLPDDATEVRLDYTAPTGSTGHTLDSEVGRLTAL